MSRKKVGIRLIVWAICIYAWIGAFVYFGAPADSEFIVWSLRGGTVAALFLVGCAVWNFANPATYYVGVSDERLVVEYPHSETLSFELDIQDIHHIESRTKLDHAGKRSEGHFIVTEAGMAHRITTNYFSSIRQIHKALQTVKPSISYEHKRTQSIL